MEIYLPSVEISSGFLVVADVTVQPNVGIICVVLFGSDVVGRDLYEHQSLFDLKGSNLLLMMTCFDVIGWIFLILLSCFAVLYFLCRDLLECAYSKVSSLRCPAEYPHPRESQLPHPLQIRNYHWIQDH